MIPARVAIVPITAQPQALSSSPFRVSPVNRVVRSDASVALFHAAGDPRSTDLRVGLAAGHLVHVDADLVFGVKLRLAAGQYLLARVGAKGGVARGFGEEDLLRGQLVADDLPVVASADHCEDADDDQPGGPPPWQSRSGR